VSYMYVVSTFSNGSFGLYNVIVSHCWRTLRVEGHSAAGWGIGGSVKRQTAGPKSVRLGKGPPLIALHCLLLNAGQHTTYCTAVLISL